MRRFAVWLALVLLAGCTGRTAPPADAGAPPADAGAPASESPGPTGTASLPGQVISAAERVQAETTLRVFFQSLATGNCAAAWALLAPDSQAQSSQQSFCDGWAQVDGVELLSVTGMRLVDGQWEEVAPNESVEQFRLALSVHPRPGTVTGWTDGENTRFLRMSRVDTSRWLIGPLTTSP